MPRKFFDATRVGAAGFSPPMPSGQRAPAPGGALALFLLLPLAAHLGFSGLGFAPTDQGFILAGARRIFDGEVPHRDFITVRPAGSLLLHAPVAGFGGAAALWISRAVAWLALAATAWIWTGILFGAAVGPALRIALAATAAMLSAHTFPVMAWHTIDAAFLSSAGIALAADGGGARRAAGWLLLGLAPLCRQNFVVVAPAAILLFGHGGRLAAWALAVAPGFAYVAWIAAAGGLGDALVQLRTHGAAEAWEAGVLRYLTRPGTWIGAGAGLVAAVAARGASLAARTAATGVAFSVAGLAASGFVPGGQPFPWFGAFVLFGAAGTLVVGRVFTDGGSPQVRRSLLACVVAWTVSLSIGYDSPALAAGPLVLVVFALSGTFAAREVHDARAAAAAGLLAVVVAAAFTAGRHEVIYRDRPARELTFDVGSHLAAGRFLRTNPRTGLFLEELAQVDATARERGKQLAVLPDFAAWWVGTPASNPLPVDWALDVELARPELVGRVVGALHARRGTIVVAVQKYETHSAPGGYAPLSPTRYQVVNAVRRDFTKIGETLLFELYE